MSKRKVTKESISERLEKVSNILDTEIEKSMKSLEKNKSTRCLKKVSKEVEKLKKDIKKLKNESSRTDYSNNPFSKKLKISNELATFLGVQRGTLLSREEVQCAMSSYIHLKPDEEREKILKWSYLNEDDRDLRDPTNKRALIPDEKLSHLLKYDEYTQSVLKGELTNKKGIAIKDDKLYFCTLIVLLQRHFS